MNNNPIIAVTMGDPSGIGPEVVTKALLSPAITFGCRLVVIGNIDILESTMRGLDICVNVVRISSVEEAPKDSISILDPANLNPEEVSYGQVSAASGKASVEWILLAGKLAVSGKIQAIATAPIHKEAARAAGYEAIGHMELFQDLTQTEQVATMLTAGNLRVVHLTTHRSLAKAVEYVTKDNIVAKLKLTDSCFRDWGFSSPRIAVAALNPHGGDGGLIGTEEGREIAPAIDIARTAGLNVAGPIPADSVFPQAINNLYDVVLALYHDQGHIPIKVKDFDGSISITLGIPFIRTSVDHGTAFDIAGKGIAIETGMVKAIEAAKFIATTGSLPND